MGLVQIYEEVYTVRPCSAGISAAGGTNGGARGFDSLFLSQILCILSESLGETYMPFVDKGLLNEFAMMYALRERFPLHYVVFRQTSSHLPHEANVEQVFSRSGLVGPEHAA